MPKFTIERGFNIPHYKHSTYEAETVEEACRLALADDDWNDMKEDWESAGETRISGAWAGEKDHVGDCLPHPTGIGIQTSDGINSLFRVRVDEMMCEVMADLTQSRATPELQLAIDAATDILARAALEVRKLNAG